MGQCALRMSEEDSFRTLLYLANELKLNKFMKYIITESALQFNYNPAYWLDLLRRDANITFDAEYHWVEKLEAKVFSQVNIIH